MEKEEEQLFFIIAIVAIAASIPITAIVMITSAGWSG